MNQQEALDFLEGLRYTELFLIDLRRGKQRLAEKLSSVGERVDPRRWPDVHLVVARERTPHFSSFNLVARARSIKGIEEVSGEYSVYYLFKLRGITPQDGKLLITGEASAHKKLLYVGSPVIDENPVQVEFVVYGVATEKQRKTGKVVSRVTF